MEVGVLQQNDKNQILSLLADLDEQKIIKFLTNQRRSLTARELFCAAFILKHNESISKYITNNKDLFSTLKGFRQNQEAVGLAQNPSLLYKEGVEVITRYML